MQVPVERVVQSKIPTLVQVQVPVLQGRKDPENDHGGETAADAAADNAVRLDHVAHDAADVTVDMARNAMLCVSDLSLFLPQPSLLQQLYAAQGLQQPQAAAIFQASSRCSGYFPFSSPLSHASAFACSHVPSCMPLPSLKTGSSSLPKASAYADPSRTAMSQTRAPGCYPSNKSHGLQGPIQDGSLGFKVNGASVAGGMCQHFLERSATPRGGGREAEHGDRSPSWSAYGDSRRPDGQAPILVQEPRHLGSTESQTKEGDTQCITRMLRMHACPLPCSNPTMGEARDFFAHNLFW